MRIREKMVWRREQKENSKNNTNKIRKKEKNKIEKKIKNKKIKPVFFSSLNKPGFFKNNL